jgi:hypothetical protein
MVLLPPVLPPAALTVSEVGICGVDAAERGVPVRGDGTGEGTCEGLREVSGDASTLECMFILIDAGNIGDGCRSSLCVKPKQSLIAYSMPAP